MYERLETNIFSVGAVWRFGYRKRNEEQSNEMWIWKRQSIVKKLLGILVFFNFQLLEIIFHDSSWIFVDFRLYLGIHFHNLYGFKNSKQIN